MPLASSDDLVLPAREHGRGVGAFNVIQLEHAEAFTTAAERVGCGVILQISQNAVSYHGGLAPIAAATLAVAAGSSTPAVVHLDHAEYRDPVTDAIQNGCTSVTYDGSTRDYAANAAGPAAVGAPAHARGVWVEAELGEVGGKDGVHAAGVRTYPAEAVGVVRDTGVDAPAVAVGSS